MSSLLVNEAAGQDVTGGDALGRDFLLTSASGRVRVVHTGRVEDGGLEPQAISHTTKTVVQGIRGKS